MYVSVVERYPEPLRLDAQGPCQKDKDNGIKKNKKNQLKIKMLHWERF
jgi:hypothetical protein